MKQRVRSKIGDIIEFQTASGFAYALVSHIKSKPENWGSLLRVLDGYYKNRTTHFGKILDKPAKITVFFPLGAALRQGIGKIITNVSLPEWAVHFPIFRNGIPDETGFVHKWWLWDGEKEWPAGALTNSIEALPELAVVNDTFLIEMIESEIPIME